jgi:hypothetical protein
MVPVWILYFYLSVSCCKFSASTAWFSLLFFISFDFDIFFCEFAQRLKQMLSENRLLNRFVKELEQFDQPNAVFKVSHCVHDEQSDLG